LDPKRVSEIHGLFPDFRNRLFSAVLIYIRALPDSAREGAASSPFLMPMLDAMQESISVAFSMIDVLTKNSNGHSFTKGFERIDPDIIKFRQQADAAGKRLDPPYLALYLQDHLNPLFSQLVNAPFSDGLRQEHQFVVAPSGSGKTTYLSNWIQADLDRVAAGECSVVVMDTKNELVPAIARLARFAPGGDLHGRLTYIEPSIEFPPALNIFDMSTATEEMSKDARADIVRSAEAMVSFFLRSIVEMDTSGQMKTALRFLVPAVMSIKDATLATLMNVLDRPSDYADHFKSLDPAVYAWFERRLLNRTTRGSYGVTIDALYSRLDGFLATDLFREMFRHPRARLNLFQETQQPRVILINAVAARLHEITAPFGRYFIAQLWHAIQARMLIPKATRLPLFVYIDEAADVIAEEDLLRDISNKSRSQLAAFTIAVQRETDVSASVLPALKSMAIQARPRKGQADLTVRDQAVSLAVPNVNFETQPRMSESQWQELIRQERTRLMAAPLSAHPSPTAKEVSGAAPDEIDTAPQKW
jgi:hypothetical protein